MILCFIHSKFKVTLQQLKGMQGSKLNRYVEGVHERGTFSIKNVAV